MKKQLLSFSALLICALFFIPSGANATKVYSVNESFNTAPAATNWGFATIAGHSFAYDATNLLEQIRWSASSTSAKTITTVVAGTDNKITIEMILKFYSSGNSGSAGSLYFLDSGGKAIFGICMRYTSSGQRIGRSTNYTTAYPSSADALLNVVSPTAKITVVLDMVAKTYTYSAVDGTFNYITKVFTQGSNSASNAAAAFIDATAGTDLATLSSVFYKSSTLSGTTGYDLMSIGISTEQTVSSANVTVNYLDPSGASIKTARVAADNVVGTTYTALLSDKASFTSGGYYYVYDAASTTSDNAVVTVDGLAAINLKFKKTAVATGIYSWTGVTNGNWNELDNNFSTDGINSLAYQLGNEVTFTAAGTQKTVSLNSVLDMADKNLTISGNGYSIAGSGSLTGTGMLNVNLANGETASLGLTNNLTGGLAINGGTAEITADAAATKFTMADGSKIKLNTGANFTKAIAGTGTISIEAASNKWYNPTITGATTINLILDNAGSYSSNEWISEFKSQISSGVQVNVSTPLVSPDKAGYAVNDLSVANAKVNLGDNTSLKRFYITNNATVPVGELTGTGTLEGYSGTSTLSYNIGSLNTDATFNGTIANAVSTAALNINKAGTGTWTLTGTNDLFTNGSLNVNAGKLVLNGSISSGGIPVIVATGATLGGKGTISGTTTVNGAIEGSLNFAGDLTLAGTTNLVVNGFGATQYDSISVAGIMVYGGTLNVTVNAAAPANNTAIKLIKAPYAAGSFAVVNIPANYSFNNSTGILTYTVGTKLTENAVNNFNIYPTVTSDNLHIEGDNIASVQLVNMLGQTVKESKISNNKITINLKKLSTGTYLAKVRFADTSLKVQRILFER